MRYLTLRDVEKSQLLAAKRYTVNALSVILNILTNSIHKLKQTALSDVSFTWEREDAIDRIAEIGGAKALNVLMEISLYATYAWERTRALERIISLTATPNPEKIAPP
jgi:hypothetical protein